MNITFEKTGVSSIDTCMKALINTYEGTVPGERGFGINIDCLDLPPAQAINAFAIDLSDKVKEFISGHELDSVEKVISPDGKIIISVKIKEGGDE